MSNYYSQMSPEGRASERKRIEGCLRRAEKNLYRSGQSAWMASAAEQEVRECRMALRELASIR